MVTVSPSAFVPHQARLTNERLRVPSPLSGISRDRTRWNVLSSLVRVLTTTTRLVKRRRGDSLFGCSIHIAVGLIGWGVWVGNEQHLCWLRISLVCLRTEVSEQTLVNEAEASNHIHDMSRIPPQRICNGFTSMHLIKTVDRHQDNSQR